MSGGGGGIVLGGLDVVFENESGGGGEIPGEKGGGRPGGDGGRGAPRSSASSAFGPQCGGGPPRSGAASAIGALGCEGGGGGGEFFFGGGVGGRGRGGGTKKAAYDADDPTIYSAPGIMVKPGRELRRLSAPPELSSPAATAKMRDSAASSSAGGGCGDAAKPKIVVSTDAAGLKWSTAPKRTPTKVDVGEKATARRVSSPAVVSVEPSDRQQGQRRSSVDSRKRRRSSAASYSAVAVFATDAATTAATQTDSGERLRCCGKRTYSITLGLACCGVSVLVAGISAGGRIGRAAGGYAYDHGLLGGLGAGAPGVVGNVLGGQGSSGGDGNKLVGGNGTAGENLTDVGDFSGLDAGSGLVVLSPTVEKNYGETSQPFPAGTRRDVAMFWQVPRSGSNVVMAYLGQCLKLVVASDLGRSKQYGDTLKVYETIQGIKFVNVDPTTASGVQRAVALGMASSSIVDVAFTPLFSLASTMFTPSNRGRAFALFRHPVERAASEYYQAKKSDASLRDVSLEEWARWSEEEGGPGDNWMVRSLVGATGVDMSLPLEDLDRDLALEILRRKIVVGLAEDVTGALGRFEQFFGWDELLDEDLGMRACRNNLVEKLGGSKPNMVEEGSEAWKLLAERNRYDLELYENAMYLYRLQAR